MASDNPFEAITSDINNDSSSSGTADPAAGQSASSNTSSNPFQAITSDITSSNTSNGGVPASDPGFFMTAVDNFNRQFGKVAEGGLKALDHATGGYYSNQIKQFTAQQNAEIANEQSGIGSSIAASMNGQGNKSHPVAAGVGSILGAVGLGGYAAPLIAAAPEGIIGATAASALGGGLLSAASAYSAPGATAKDALIPGALGAVAAGGLTAGAHAISPLIGGLLPEKGLLAKAYSPANAAMNTLVDRVGNNVGPEGLTAAGAAAKNLKVPLSPAEQIGNDVTNLEYGQLNNPNAINAVKAAANAKDAALRPQVDATLHQFNPANTADATKTAITQGYENLKQLNLPSDALDALKSNKVIADHLDNFASKNKYSDVVGAPDTNVAKLDQIKQSLNSAIYNDSHSLASSADKLEPTTRKAYQEAAAQINSTIDQIAPETKDLRQLAQRQIFQSKINDQLGSIPKNGPGNVSLDSIYKKLWGNDNKVEDFISAVKDSGGDVQNAKDVIQVVGQVYKSPIMQLAGKSTGTAATMGSAIMPHKSGGFIDKLVEHFTSTKYNEALTKLMLSPDWQEPVKQALEAQGTMGKFGQITNLVNKIVQATGKGIAKGSPVAGGLLQSQGVPVLQSVPVLGHIAGSLTGQH